jgi:DNA polymerase-3 subunit epsilon
MGLRAAELRPARARSARRGLDHFGVSEIQANLLDAPLAIVDLETTGGDMRRDRITEVAVIGVERGERVGEWSSLVNPEAGIPPAIQTLTGITEQMVEGAPRFRSLAAELYERLAGRVFVAHNARFDYGFLQREFAAAGIRFEARTLCSVRLSRRLYSEHVHHDLDSLIARHGLACEPRHRAMPDAEAVWQFLAAARREHPSEALADAAERAARQAWLPPQLDAGLVDAIPEAPGVYTFFAQDGAPLYVGAALALRSRVLAHFAPGGGSPSPAKLAREVYGIEYERSAGALGAELRAAARREQLAPRLNRKSRAPHASAPCEWPWRGPIGVIEQHGDEERGDARREMHVVYRWALLGSAREEDEVHALLENLRTDREPRFDATRYAILSRHLAKGGTRIVVLG